MYCTEHLEKKEVPMLATTIVTYVCMHALVYGIFVKLKLLQITQRFGGVTI